MYNVTGLSDKELKELSKAISAEKVRRRAHKAKIREQRADWVGDRWRQYLRHPNAIATCVGRTVIVAIYDRNRGHHIKKAFCAPGDSFDMEVGIAVAMAKHNGEEIPDFI
jgi:hypothetical protein